MQTFYWAGATVPTIANMSRALPVWITISIAILLLYFCNQQDISTDEDKDDRGRKQALRAKCLYAMAVCSLLTAVVLIVAVNFSTGEWDLEWLRS